MLVPLSAQFKVIALLLMPLVVTFVGVGGATTGGGSVEALVVAALDEPPELTAVTLK